MSSGTLTGAGFLSVAGPFTWSGGIITGSGGTEIAGTGIAVFDGSSGPMILDGRSFNDYGTTTFLSPPNPLALQKYAVFTNYGNFDFQSDGAITTDGTNTAFNNAPNGFMSKSGGTGTMSIQAPSNNDSTVFA